jgi:hypothetical protein
LPDHGNLQPEPEHEQNMRTYKIKSRMEEIFNEIY